MAAVLKGKGPYCNALYDRLILQALFHVQNLIFACSINYQASLQYLKILISNSNTRTDDHVHFFEYAWS